MSNAQKLSPLMTVTEKMLNLPLKQVFDENIDTDYHVYNLWKTAYQKNLPLPIKATTNKSLLLITKALTEGFQLELIDQFQNNKLPSWLLKLTDNPDLFKKNQLKNQFRMDQKIVFDPRLNTKNIKTLLNWDPDILIACDSQKVHPRLLQCQKFFLKMKIPIIE